MEPRIDWMNTGKEYWDGNQDKIKKFISEVSWKEIPCTMAFCQGEAIKETIKQLKIPKVSHVCDSHEMAPFGLIGIRGHFKNADVDFFAVDDGVSVTSLCAIVTEING